MLPLTKILKVGIGISCMTLASICLYGQGKQKESKQRPSHIRPIIIGFQSGRELLFNSTPLIHSRQSKEHYGISNRLVLRKPLNAHFKVETGINYNNYRNNSDYIFGGYRILSPKISLSITTQYYFLPEQCRFRPFIGAGFQYNFNTENNVTFVSPFNSDYPVPVPPCNSGTKYISVLFTQGMTFEVSTKIEINESFHFLPGEKAIGIDLGIGYKLP